MENIHPVDSFFVQFDDPFEWAKARISENGNYIRVPLPNTDSVVNYQQMNNNNYGPMALKKSVLTQNKNLTLFHENKDSMYFVNNKELLILNNETFEGKKYTISGELKHLGSNFYFSSYHYNNAFLKGDTLYQYFANKFTLQSFQNLRIS